ncbi:WD40 repeat-like protein [Schizopora paradoxa]|uniref:WD40 repeat-like protein n=1 Tax=Schizopora paradoxa TaxID=27342 RepID=A0A0H2SNX8_9AGAM|nr:WD40 repeat-like protein [Schizopora paradoxa]
MSSVAVGEHVVIRCIDIVFNDDVKPSGSLVLKVNGKRKSVKKKDSSGRKHCWNADKSDEIFIFPNDTLTVAPQHSRFNLKRRGMIEEYNISGKDIHVFCHRESIASVARPLEYTLIGTDSNLAIKVDLRWLKDAVDEFLTESLCSVDNALQDMPSSETTLTIASKLQSGLDLLGDKVVIVGNLIKAIEKISELHPMVKAAISALLLPYKLLESEHNFIKDFMNLVDDIRFLLVYLADVEHTAKIAAATDSMMKIMSAVIEASRFIHKFTTKSAIAQFGAAQFRTKLDDHREELSTLRRNIDSALIVQSAGDINHITVEVDGMKNRTLEKELRDWLSPVEHDGYLAEGCLPETRVKILEKVEDWLKDTNEVDGKKSPNVLWISGAPGAGKSTIAASIIRKAQHKRAAFLVTRDVPERRDPRNIWRTIAFALAKMHPPFKDNITEVRNSEEPDIIPKNADVRDQFRCLIKEPFEKNAEGSSCVIVIIDALDECRTDDKDWRDLLNTIAAWSKLPSNIKLIVTSRDEKDIRDKLSEVSKPIVLESGESVSKDTSDDIRRFFVESFDGISVPDEAWPGEEAIEQLTKYAAGLFIWARTVVEYVGKRKQFPGPVQKLKGVLGNLGKSNDKTNSKIDRLYGQVVYETLSDQDDEYLEAAKFVLATIVLAKAPLETADVAGFLAIQDSSTAVDPLSFVQSVVEAFSSVISIRMSDKRLQVCHATFAEFILVEGRMRATIQELIITDKKREDQETLESYTIRRSEQGARLAQSCLTVMNNKLTFNIGRIRSSYYLNDDIHDLDTIVEEHIRIHPSLLYSCQYWSEHLIEVDAECGQIMPILLHLLTVFLNTHILHWLEVLSLTKTVHRGAYLLSCAARFADLKASDEDLSQISRDASIFTTTFQKVITDSAPHIYLSALPFAPKRSRMAVIYGPLYANKLSFVTGVEWEWKDLLMVIRGHTGPISCIAYFPDGKWIASGSHDKTIRIWDAYSGEAIAGPSKILVHTDELMSLSISPDGQRIVSACRDGSLWVWDVDSGRCTVASEVKDDKTTSVAYSPDPNRKWIASGSSSGMVNIWDVTNVTLKSSSLKHKGIVNSVAFTPDGTRLVSGSDDGTMIIWETMSGNLKALGRPLKGHTDAVSSVAVSADGKYILSGSIDKSMRLWNCEGMQYGYPMEMHSDPILSVAFSPSSKVLISCSPDGYLSFYRRSDMTVEGLRSRKAKFEEMYGQNVPRSIAFSPHGHCVASGCDDATIQLWVARSYASVSMEIHRPYHTNVFSFAFEDKGGWLLSLKALGERDTYLQIERTPSGDRSEGGAGGGFKHTTFPESCITLARMKSVPGTDKLVSACDDGSIISYNKDDGGYYYEASLMGNFWANSESSSSPRIFTAVDIVPDLNLAAFGFRDGSVSIYRPSDFRYTFPGHSGVVSSVALSPDGSTVASGSDDRKIRLWRIDLTSQSSETGGTIDLADCAQTVLSIKFSPDGKRLAAGCSDGFMSIWDVKTQIRLLYVENFHKAAIHCVSFSPNELVIASGSEDGAIRFRNAESGECLGEIRSAHRGPVNAIEFSPDGKLVASSTAVKSWRVRVWEVDTNQSAGRPLILDRKPPQDLASSLTPVAFEEFELKRVPRKHNVNNESATRITSSFAFFDDTDSPLIGDWSYINEDGWMCNRVKESEGASADQKMFWLPPENRDNFYWPRTRNGGYHYTRAVFDHFKHGVDWVDCRSIRREEAQT